MNYTKFTLLIFIAATCSSALSASSRATRRLTAIAGHIPHAHIQSPATCAISVSATATPTTPPSKATKKTVANMSIDELLDDLTSGVHPLIKLYYDYKNNPCTETLNAFQKYLATRTAADINNDLEQTRDTRTNESIADIALDENKPEILKALISAGYTFNTADHNINTALIVSAQHGNLDKIKCLIACGADINAADKYGRTALIEAAGNGHLAIVHYLVAQGANIHATDKYGWTALMGAAGNGYLAIMEYLVAQGANINVANNNGRTALMCAIYKGNLAIVEYLITQGANINAINNFGSTTLMLATHLGHLAIVQYLVAHGAKINLINKNGKTALMYAQENKHHEIIIFLENTLLAQKLAAQRAEQALLKAPPCYALHVIHSNL